MLRRAADGAHFTPTLPEPCTPMTTPLLFTPIALRDVTLRNRVVIAPMATKH